MPIDTPPANWGTRPTRLLPETRGQGGVAGRGELTSGVSGTHACRSPGVDPWMGNRLPVPAITGETFGRDCHNDL